MLNNIKVSIRFKLIAILSIIVIICVSIMGWLVFNNMKNTFANDIKTSGSEAVKKLDENIDGFLKNNEDTIKLLTSNITITDSMYWTKELDLSFLDNALQNVKDAYPEILRVYVAQPNNVLHAYPKMEVPNGVIMPEKEWFKGAVEQKGIHWTTPYVDTLENVSVVTLSAPLTTSKGELGGVICIDISLESIEKLIKEIKIGSAGEVILTDSARNIIMSKNNSELGKPLNIKELNSVLGNKKSGAIDYTSNDIKKMAIFYQNNRTGWNIVGSINYSEVNDSISPILNTILISGIIIVVIAIVTVYLLTKKMLNSIKIIKEDMEKVGEGDLTTEVFIKSNDEVGLLSQTLNSAISNIRSLMKNINNASTNINEISMTIASTSEETTDCINEISKAISEVVVSTYKKSESVNIGLEKTNELSNDIEKISSAIEISKDGFIKLDNLNIKGLEKINELKLKTEDNKDAFKEVETTVREVNCDIEKIGSIVKSINGIASQTNLLALNASIEAARALSKGSGFSLVANEIKKLANQSNEAIEKILEHVNEIQIQSNESVNAVEFSILAVEEQEKAVIETEDIFYNINEEIKFINNEMKEIVTLNSEMLLAQGEIEKVMENIAVSSNETEKASEEISEYTKEQLTAFKEVSKTAEALNSLVEDFNIEVRKFKI